MALFIASGVQQHRHDSTAPVITTSGVTDTGFIKVADWLYIPALSTFSLNYPNRSANPLTLELRNTKHGSGWTNTSNISGSTSTGTYSRGGSSDGFGEGGYYATAISTAKCSIQATCNVNTFGGSWISLQNGGGTVVHDLTNAGVAHSVSFGQLSIGTIRELGVVKTSFKYFTGDTLMIDLDNGIVRYFLISPAGTMTLLRTTRSKLTSAPKPEFGMYFHGESLSNILFMNNETASTSLETIAALVNFQDWKNDFIIASTAESLSMVNGEPEFTFPNVKKRIRSLNAALAVRDKAQRLDYEDFFNYHGTEKEFLFVDYAKKDVNGYPTEFWAKFASPFGDKSLNSCLSSHNAQITESYRLDYIPLPEDTRTLMAVVDGDGNAIVDDLGEALTILI